MVGFFPAFNPTKCGILIPPKTVSQFFDTVLRLQPPQVQQPDATPLLFKVLWTIVTTWLLAPGVVEPLGQPGKPVLFCIPKDFKSKSHQNPTWVGKNPALSGSLVPPGIITFLSFG